MTWILDIGGIHLTSATANQGGAANTHASTPFSVRTGYTPKVAQPRAAWQGGAPLANGAALAFVAYENVEEDIPIAVYGSSHLNAATRLQELKRALMRATMLQPAVWRWRPEGATYDLYCEVYTAVVQEAPGGGDIGIGAMEGGYDVEATISLVRSPFFGAKDLDALISAATVTNQGTGSPDNVEALEASVSLKGDLIYEGQPLVIQVAKPAAQTAAQLYLATIHSRTLVSIADAQTTTNQTNGQQFDTTGAIDLSAMRNRAGLSLRVVARVTTLTAPAKAELQARIEVSGTRIWSGDWVPLGSNTTAQLADLFGTGLDALRVPLSAAMNIVIVVAMRSTDGTSVGATLDYVEAILYYDWAIVEASGGLASGQQYQLFGAQNLAGGGWLPQTPAGALVTDGSDVAVKPAVVKGTLPRAFAGASLYCAWKETDGGHTKTDTTTVTVKHAPLYRSIRGAS